MATITVVPTVENSTGPSDPGRIRLDVTDSGTPNLFAATVIRNDPDGRQVPVRTFDGNPLVLSTSGSNRVGLVYDYEAPFGLSVTYTTAENPATVSTPVVLDSDKAWLVHPGVPEVSRPITIGAVSERVRAVSRGVFYPAGRKFPVVQTAGQRQAAEWTLTVYTADADELDDLETLLEDASALLLNIPAGKPWGLKTEYVSVGDTSEVRPVRTLAEPSRLVTLPLTVCTRPAGGTQAERTYADLLDFTTYGAMAAAYPSYLALLAGP